MGADVKPWKPEYEPWRHGGWYTNVVYPSGAVGCVSRNYPDHKWRIACGRPEGETFQSRAEATFAERGVALSEFLELIAKRCDEAAVVFDGTEAGRKFVELRDFAIQATGRP